MRHSRLREEQIIGILRERKAGMKVAGWPEARHRRRHVRGSYTWKSKNGGLEVSEAGG